MSIIQHSSPPLPPPLYKEIARYMKASSKDSGADDLIDKCLVECNGKINGKVVYREFPIYCNGNELNIGFTSTQSNDLKRLLLDNNCTSIILFAATIGLGIDRLILRNSRISPAKALCLQAIGSERVEALCNVFSLELKGKYEAMGCTLTPRFSPGYGDLPLSMQKEIFTALNCERLLGITLNDSLLMTPTKSVTAIIGVKNSKENK